MAASSQDGGVMVHEDRVRRDSGGFTLTREEMEERRFKHHHYEDPVELAAKIKEERRRRKEEEAGSKEEYDRVLILKKNVTRLKRFPFSSSREVRGGNVVTRSGNMSPSSASSTASDRSRHVRDGKTLFETNL